MTLKVLLGEDLLDVGNEGHGGVDDEHTIHINTYDGDDGLIDDPQTNYDINAEGSHDGLLDNPQTNSDTNAEGSHDGLLDNPQTNSDTNAEGSHDGLLDNPQTNSDRNDKDAAKNHVFPLVTPALDHIDLIDSLCDFESKTTQKKPADHIKNRIHPLVENKRAVEKPGLDNTNPLWMNNCCESVNHILKQAVSWKSQKLVDLSHKLHSVIERQFKELRRTLTDKGDFALCTNFAKSKISRDVWLNLSKTKKLHARFSELDFVRSTDGQKVLKEPKHGGRKPNQRKRNINAHTYTPKNVKIKNA
ncbi:hypothetical protein PoB_002106900 [Plakobranchus ocellatus]|uniref:Transposase n=1 Tax=Plakobranchus ocellatus TaxID=259542 RepID=A0AAV3ZJN4_9GAST|nr:hypothetical protein PoB_002106900 [Plakobranchus ocellatus]